MELRSLKSPDLTKIIENAIEVARSQYPDFENAYETYTQEYGRGIISVNEPTMLNGATDPVILIIGRNFALRYNDSKRELCGSEGRTTIEPGTTCIIGRRQPQDSKVIAWGGKEVELGDYNSSSGTIPSRVHGAIVALEDGVYYSDLCSSSGTIVVGDLQGKGQFVRVYDPGTQELPLVKVERINTSRNI